MKTLRIVMMGLAVCGLMMTFSSRAQAQNAMDPEDAQTLRDAVEALSSSNEELSRALSNYADEQAKAPVEGSDPRKAKAKHEENSKLLINSARALDKVRRSDLSLKVIMLSLQEVRKNAVAGADQLDSTDSKDLAATMLQSK